MPFEYYLLLLSICTMAFLYSSVGHGGASGYLAVLALFGTHPAVMKSSALILNILVSFLAFFQYYKEGFFRWKVFFPFAITSIPASFLGAFFSFHDALYKKMLGICLIFPILRLTGVLGKEQEETKSPHIVIALLIGALIGFLSGMLGIGGGIILSPVILLFHWAKMKETAAISALFILVNSVSGLLGLFLKGFSYHANMNGFLIAAFIGGVAGSYFGSSRFNNSFLKYILAIVLSIACAKLLLS